MNFPPDMCGFQRITSSGVIGDSGKPILIAGMAVESGATAAVPWFLNGAAGSSPIAFRGDGVGSKSSVVSIPKPVMLPLGCYVSFDANTTAVSVFYIEGS